MAEFVEGFEVMAPLGKAVTIFGSARTKPNDRYYKAAEETGRLLAQAGYAVITGGGPGIMEAGNKGAFEAGGQSAGLNITLPQEQFSNQYQTVSLDFHYFYARKVMFVKYASAFICFPGGYGTLDEFFETMTLIQTLKVQPFPVILFGTPHWTGLVEWMRNELNCPNFIHAGDLDIFSARRSPARRGFTCEGKREKNLWWHPRDKELQKIALAANAAEGRSAARGRRATGEGTRYGSKRPRRNGNGNVPIKAKKARPGRQK